jgi:hypothetical protein
MIMLHSESGLSGSLATKDKAQAEQRDDRLGGAGVWRLQAEKRRGRLRAQAEKRDDQSGSERKVTSGPKSTRGEVALPSMIAL